MRVVLFLEECDYQKIVWWQANNCHKLINYLSVYVYIYNIVILHLEICVTVNIICTMYCVCIHTGYILLELLRFN